MESFLDKWIQVMIMKFGQMAIGYKIKFGQMYGTARPRALFLKNSILLHPFTSIQNFFVLTKSLYLQWFRRLQGSPFVHDQNADSHRVNAERGRGQGPSIFFVTSFLTKEQQMEYATSHTQRSKLFYRGQKLLSHFLFEKPSNSANSCLILEKLKNVGLRNARVEG